MTIINVTLDETELEKAKDIKDEKDTKEDTDVRFLLEMSPLDAALWVEANSGSKEDVTRILKVLTSSVVYLMKKDV